MPQPCGLGQYYKTFLHLHISSDHTQLYPVIAKIIYHKKKEVKNIIYLFLSLRLYKIKPLKTTTV